MIPEGMFHLDLSSIGAEPLEEEDPRRIGAFPILGVLGSGGMGRVYLGLAPGGYAAVKRVLPYLSGDRTFLRHFGQELDNLARLPAGVSARLLAADRTARPPWFATEYIPGVTLQDAAFLNGGSLPIDAVWALLRDLAERLASIADLELVHRDLKPSNVMLTGEGVTLIDFGVARAADQSTVTATGLIVGTPAYMAPEQARATREPTPAVDVFSLGGLITYAATGEPPFGAGSGTDLLFRIVHEPPNLDSLHALDAVLAAVVESCLAKDPAARPTARELADLAARRADPGRPQWPTPIADRIAVRVDFAASRPAFEPHGEDDDGVTEFEAAEEQGAERVADRAAEPVAVDAPSKDRERRRRRLVLIVPLILATGTVGTLIAMNKVPFVTSGRSDLTPTVTISMSDAHLGAKATGTVTHRATPTSTRPSTTSSASPTASSNAGTGNDPTTQMSTGSASNSTPHSGTTTTTAVTSRGPAGPGNDSTYVSGSEQTVDSCAGWLDLPSALYFEGTVSAGSNAGCEEAFSFTSGFGTGPGSFTTNDITASDGNTATTTSCGSACGYMGDYQLYAKICVWNTANSGDKACSATYEYDNTTGKVTTYS